jgi:hypothetical protein
MATLLQLFQNRQLVQGAQVVKATQTPPNSGSSATLFTVAGGMVVVTSLVGRVVTVLSGTTGAVSLGTVPTAGTASTTGIATATVIGGGQVGAKYAVVGTAAGAATTLANGGASALAGVVPFLSFMEFIVDPGTINITTSVATMTGAISWYLSYVPLDVGASVS